MERILEIAKKYADSADVHSTSNSNNKMDFQNFKLTDMESSIQSGYALRIFKDGCLGTSHTQNLLDPEKLVQDALESLKGKVEGSFKLPERYDPREVNVFDPSINDLKNSDIIGEMKELSEYIKAKVDPKGQLNFMSGFGQHKTRIINTNGLDVSSEGSFFWNYAMLLYPSSYSNISNMTISKGRSSISKDDLERSIDMYNRSLKEVTVKPGDIDVIFTPSTLGTLLWRVWTGANAKSVYDNISPIKEKVGEKIFSDNFTYVDDPFSGSYSDCGFDDEGTKKEKFNIIENGEFKGIYTNLDYAKKLNITPTGHGFREGGDSISVALRNQMVMPGETSFEDMIKNTKRGILLYGALGAHSGNIPNGDFSIGLNPGLYIENGEVIGRVKDGMIAGNVYDVMKNIKCIENKTHQMSSGIFPSMCIGDIKFSV